ncbi:sulfotransferase [Endothiovibrio diazotrophicus]
MTFRMTPLARPAIDRSIFLTGSTRTGTSIFGTLLQSLEAVEFAYEPPMLNFLLPQIADLPPASWRLLFEAYLFEEVFVQAIPGRRLNYNRMDTRSSAWMALSETQIEERIGTHWDRRRILDVVPQRRLAFSMPNALPWVPELVRQYPALSVVVMVRKPESVLASIAKLGWYETSELTGEARYYPLKSREDVNVHYWVPDDQEEAFLAMNPMARAVYQYAHLYEHALRIDDALFVDYDAMCRQPHAYFKELAARLDVRYGEKTEGILAAFREPAKDRSIDLSGVDGQLVERMHQAYRGVQARTLTLGG